MASTGFTFMTCSDKGYMVFTRPGFSGILRICTSDALFIARGEMYPERFFYYLCSFGFVETGMNGNGSYPTMKNCEGSTGTRNRPLRGQCRSFQVIEAPRGRPFGGGEDHRNGIGISQNTVIVEFSGEILTIFFSTLLGATARSASAPAAVASPLER